MEGTNVAGFRWNTMLPVVAASVGAMLVFLAALAGHAFRQREAMALEGRVLGLATDPQTILDQFWSETAAGSIHGLMLEDPQGTTLAKVGETDLSSPPRMIDLFIGPPGGGRGRPWFGPPSGKPGQRGAHGRKQLLVFLDEHAGSPPLPVRLLLPASVIVAFSLLGLAVLGGRLLDRERLEVERRAKGRRLEALGRAGAGLAHQLRNPLATIKGTAQLLAEGSSSETDRRRADSIVTQSTRMDDMLGSLLDFARPPEAEPTDIDVVQIIDDLVAEDPTIRIDVEPGLKVRVDPGHLEHILENLLSNARAHRPENSPIEISGRPEGETVTITVSDRGPGPGDEPEELFQPYVTRRPDGAGLGLTIARTLAEANGGALTLEPRPGGGATATLILRSPGEAS